MIQALGTSRTTTGAVQGHSVAGIHNRGGETPSKTFSIFKINKAHQDVKR
jgi:hypothetical protein